MFRLKRIISTGEDIFGRNKIVKRKKCYDIHTIVLIKVLVFISIVSEKEFRRVFERYKKCNQTQIPREETKKY